MTKTEQKRETCEELRDSEMLCRTTGGILLFLLESAKTSTSVGYRRISCPTAIAFSTESSAWPFLGSLYLRGRRENEQQMLALGGHRFLLPLAERDFSNRTLFSNPGSMIAVTVLEPSPRLLPLLHLRRKLAGSSVTARQVGLDDRRR